MIFPTYPYELDWIAAFQGTGAFKEMMLWSSYLGSEALAGLLPLIYLGVSRRAGARLYLLYSLSRISLQILKLAFHSPRPFWMDTRVKALASSSGYSMPSGHVLAASIVWPYAAKIFDQPWAWLSAVAIILLVSVSRVYLGVHFISDVVVAWGLATGLYWGFEHLEQRVSKRFDSLSLLRRIIFVCWVVTVLLLVGVVVRLAMDHAVDPFSTYAAKAHNFGGLFRSVGELLGAGIGLILAGRWADFEVKGAWWKRGVAVGYALLVAWLIRKLAGQIPVPPTEFLHCLREFLHGMVLNLWILFLAPWILLHVDLLHKAGEE